MGFNWFEVFVWLCNLQDNVRSDHHQYSVDVDVLCKLELAIKRKYWWLQHSVLIILPNVFTHCQPKRSGVENDQEPRIVYYTTRILTLTNMHYCVAALTVHTVINGTHLIQMEHVIFDGIVLVSTEESIHYSWQQCRLQSLCCKPDTQWRQDWATTNYPQPWPLCQI